MSPSGDLVCTGVSNRDESGKGKLNFYDIKTLTLAQSVNVAKSSVIKVPFCSFFFLCSLFSPLPQVLWHKGINQIFTGCSDGVTRLLYSPRLSNKVWCSTS